MKARQILQLIAILALFVWGGMFVYFYQTGRIAEFVSPAFRILALIAGMGLLVLGAFNLLTFRQKVTCGHDHDHGHGEDCGHDHHHEDEDDHDHGHDHELPASNVVIAVLILIVPLVMATRYSQDRFSTAYILKIDAIEQKSRAKRIADGQERSAIAALKKPEPSQSAKPVVSVVPIEESPAISSPADSPPEPGPTSVAEDADTPPDTESTETAEKTDTGDEWEEFSMKDLKRMVPQNSAGNFLLDVPQIFYTAGDDELMNVMDGIPVETVAQVMPETINNPDGTRLRIFRLFIECCAADARPLSIPIDFGKKPPEFEEMGWVKVVGKMHYAKEGEEVVPLINVDSMEKTTEPENMMMY